MSQKSDILLFWSQKIDVFGFQKSDILCAQVPEKWYFVCSGPRKVIFNVFGPRRLMCLGSRKMIFCVLRSQKSDIVCSGPKKMIFCAFRSQKSDILCVLVPVDWCDRFQKSDLYCVFRSQKNDLYCMFRSQKSERDERKKHSEHRHRERDKDKYKNKRTSVGIQCKREDVVPSSLGNFIYIYLFI